MSFNFQSQKYVVHALHESKRRFYLCSQGKHLTTQAYLELFQNMHDVIVHSGGSIGHEPGIEAAVAAETGAVIATMTKAQGDALSKTAQERYLAVAFLLGSDRSRYGRLIKNLENDYLQGTNHYPTTVTGAYNLLTNWKQDPRNLMRAIGPANDGVSFTNVDTGEQDDPNEVILANNGQKGLGSGRRDKSHITCHKCKKKGHYANECDERESGAAMLMDGIAEGEFDTDEHFQFHQHDSGTALHNGTKGRVPKTWILLDNQSTVDVFHNAALLTNIRKNKTYMDIHCNAGVTSTNMIGELSGYGTVWYQPKGIANILSLARVKKLGYRVT